MSLKEKWKGISLTEKFLIGTVVILIILIILRWDQVSKEAVDGFKKLFEKPSVK